MALADLRGACDHCGAGPAHSYYLARREALLCDECAVEAGFEPCVCIEDPDDCSGPVEFRMALSGSGASIPRCESHWQARLDREQDMIPDTDLEPAWFDPSAAGERWEDD